ncbi:S8 family peptidase, partial [Leptolyngbya cf. ectocarpi LEGE 11479]
MPDQSRKFPHIYLPENGESEDYTDPRIVNNNQDPPGRDRASHARELERSIGVALQKAEAQLKSRDPEIATGEPGFYLEFQMHADKSNAFESLQNRQKKIELVAVRKIPDKEDMLLATVFVPEKASDYFSSKVAQYRDEDTKKGKPRHEKLVSRLESVELGEVKSLFTDDPALFPQNEQEVWWEIWLRNERRNFFASTAKKLNIPIKDYQITFPEREVVLAMTTVPLMARVIKNSDAVAELRIAKDTPSFFLEMGPCEQETWAEALSKQLLKPDEHAVSICLLDSGITQRHLLLSMGLEPNDMHTVEPSWGVDDRGNQWQGHGTAMAGIALYADLLGTLQTSGPIKLSHRLESVKILPNSGQNEPDLYGAITEQAISLPEIEAPDRHRVFCMAVTSDAGPPNIGIPSSCSAAVDQLWFNDGDYT